MGCCACYAMFCLLLILCPFSRYWINIIICPVQSRDPQRTNHTMVYSLLILFNIVHEYRIMPIPKYKLLSRFLCFRSLWRVFRRLEPTVNWLQTDISSITNTHSFKHVVVSGQKWTSLVPTSKRAFSWTKVLTEWWMG